MKTAYLKVFLITVISIGTLYGAQMEVKVDQQALSKQLFDAIEKEDVDEVRDLLAIDGFDVYEAVTDDNESSLHKAALIGNASIVDLLIKHDDDLLDITTTSLATPLHYAAFSGNPAVVKALLNSKPGLINEEDEVGLVPLHLAAEWGHITVVGLLLDKKYAAEVNSTNEEGNTPLHLATKTNNVDSFEDIATMLLQTGGELYKKNIYGKSPLDLILRRYGSQVVQNVEYIGAQPLFEAVRASNLDQVKTLLSQGYNPFAKDEFNKSPLRITQQHGYKELFDFLISLYTDPITTEELADLPPSDLIYYADKLWTKKSLFRSALNSMIVDPDNPANPPAGIPLDPFTRQPLPPNILAELKQHFNITEQEFKTLIEVIKSTKAERGYLSMEQAVPGEDPQADQAELDRVDKIINDFLEAKGIV